jgi:uncharacterized protein YbjT (DUF2867 family)
MLRTAMIIGATGLVGSEILNYLLEDPGTGVVKIFVRRPSGVTHQKLQEFIVDFDHINEWRQHLSGDVLFSALGTTIKQVGTREAQRVVDYDYQLRVAQSAKINGTQNYVLVSAANAHPKSHFAYTRIKGDLERDILKLGFRKTTIIRPGILKGPRQVKRFMEQMAGSALSYIPVIPGLEMLKPVSGKLVAHACVETAFDEKTGTRILGPRDVLNFLKV